MSITDELRRYIHREMWDLPKWKDELPAIADRIDAEHEKAVAAAHSNGVTEYGSMVAREYVKLPVDADGVPIRVGDVMEYAVAPHTIREVGGVGVDCFYANAYRFDAKYYRHHHEPTVEDVLREMLAGMGVDADEHCADADAYIADYAKRLRLADGEEA